MAEEKKLPTDFLPAEKASREEVLRQNRLITEAPIISGTLNGLIGLIMILNRQRQTVFLNEALKNFLETHGNPGELGKRSGEAMGCLHSDETPGGCGTTVHCKKCGAANALAEALGEKESEKECLITSQKTGDDLELKVRVQPFHYGGEDFLLMSMLDISDEKRRHALERIFFHDVINTAGGMHGIISLMADAKPEEVLAYVPPAVSASNILLDQILSQKNLAAAERGELQVKAEELDTAVFLTEIADLFRAHDVAKGRTIEVGKSCAGLRMTTDKSMLSRIVGNMVKNALEAERTGARITLSCAKAGGKIIFTVKNPTPMSEDSRLQVFKRSFSTKGAGRGLGTYSIRLLTEKYLGGKVCCEVDAAGTSFKAEYPEKIP